jgi:hypothetical protein
VEHHLSKLVIDNVSRILPACAAARRRVRWSRPTSPLRTTTSSRSSDRGCGKSTLLRMVAGLDTPTTGRMLLDGKAITGPGADRGMVFQSYTLFPWLTVSENISFGLRERGVSTTERNDIAS